MNTIQRQLTREKVVELILGRTDSLLPVLPVLPSFLPLLPSFPTTPIALPLFYILYIYLSGGGTSENACRKWTSCSGPELYTVI